MAKRIIEIEGRLAGTDLGLNLGPEVFNSIRPTSSGQEIQWTSAFTGTAVSQTFLLVFEAWFYVTNTVGMTLFRNRNSGGGVQTIFGAGAGGSFSFGVDADNLGTIYTVASTNSVIPDNQWAQWLVSSDTTSVVSPIVEHAANGRLVPASSRTTSNILGGFRPSFGDPPAATSDAFLTSNPAAANRVFLDAASFLDLTDQSNIDKFIDSNFRPVQLGADGSGATGKVPFLFMQNNVTNILRNLGSERDGDALDGTWVDAGHNPTSPARFAHQTDSNPNQSGLELSGAALGLTDTQQFSLSMWFITPSTTSAGTLVYCSDTSSSERLVIEYDISGLVIITARDSSGTIILAATATLDDISDNTWHHLGISINMQAAVSSDATRIFIDDVDAVPSVTTFIQGASINLGQTGLDFAIMNKPSLTTLTNGSFSQFWCAPGVFVDFANASVRSNYVQTAITYIPIDLGDNGETPLGVQPLIFTGQGPTFVDGNPLHNVNKGSAGGTFTVTRNAWIAPPSNPAFTQLGT